MAKKKTHGQVRPAGQIRQSQIVTTFGPGAMVDLPDHAVIVGGLDHWSGWRNHRITEDRLAAKVKALLGLPSVDFYAPPPDTDDPGAPITGITAWQFPEWFIAQNDGRAVDGVRSRPLIHRADLTRGAYEFDRKKYKVVPVRFVQACTRGHVSDINWRLFVHGEGDECARSPLWMDERGTSGDLTAITIRCGCGKFKALSAATKQKDRPLGWCKGDRPWLGQYGREHCGKGGDGSLPSRLLIRSASNAYFAQTLSVISIPEADTGVRAVVDQLWDFLEACESAEDVARERRKPRVAAGLEGFADADVWTAIRHRRGEVGGGEDVPRGIREVELETLLSSEAEVGEDKPGGDFYARAVAIPGRRSAITSKLERVVKVHRLREVIAQVGFTRFEASVSDINGELDVDVERAALAREMTWVPAIENRGEGIFLALKPAAVNAWLERPAVKARGEQLMRGFRLWAKDHGGVENNKPPGVPFIMLHSLSHLLITAVALDCGRDAGDGDRNRAVIAGIDGETGDSDAVAPGEDAVGGTLDHEDRRLDIPLHAHLSNAAQTGAVGGDHTQDVHPTGEQRAIAVDERKGEGVAVAVGGRDDLAAADGDRRHLVDPPGERRPGEAEDRAVGRAEDGDGRGAVGIDREVDDGGAGAAGPVGGGEAQPVASLAERDGGTGSPDHPVGLVRDGDVAEREFAALAVEERGLMAGDSIARGDGDGECHDLRGDDRGCGGSVDDDDGRGGIAPRSGRIGGERTGGDRRAELRAGGDRIRILQARHQP